MPSIQATLDAASTKARDDLETMARDLLRDFPQIARVWSHMGNDGVATDDGPDDLDALPPEGLDAVNEYQSAHDSYFEAFGSPGYDLTRKDASAPDPGPMTFERFAESHGLTMDARAVDARPDAAADTWNDNPETVHFHVTVTKPDTTPGFKAKRPPVVVWSGFYSVGAAHPLLWAQNGAKFTHGPDAQRPGKEDSDATARRAYESLDHKGWTGRGVTLHDERHRATIWERYKARAPLDFPGVLESLQCDSQMWESTFEEWASDCGYDTDSRKAESIYRACQDTAKTMRAALGAVAFESFLQIEP